MVEINATKGLKLTPTTAPTAAKGTMYYDSATDVVKVSTDGATFENLGDSTPAIVQAGLNQIRQNLDRGIGFSKGRIDGWSEAYISATGRQGSVDTTATSCLFDTNKYKADTSSSASSPFVVIEAAALTESNFSINNCKCLKIATGKWLVWCTSGSIAVQRAQIYKTLFYGTNGTDARIMNSYITGITALKTSVARDVGKKCYFWKRTGMGGSSYQYSTFTFSDTSTNTNCSVWSYLTASGSAGDHSLNHPNTPVSVGVNAASVGQTSDETGTDTESEEYSNPATSYHRFNSGVTFSAEARMYWLYTGTITPTYSGGGSVPGTPSAIDFTVTHSVPAMTATTEILSNYLNVIVQNLPTGTVNPNISSAIGVSYINDYEDGVNVQYKLTSSASASEFVVIEARNYVGSSYDATYDVYIKKVANGKWYVYCQNGTSEVKRAKIYANLMYSQNILNFKGVTAVKSKWSKDVGKKMYYMSSAISAGSGSGTGDTTATITFTGASSANDSLWSSGAAAFGYYAVNSNVDISRAGTIVVAFASASGSFTEIGTDLTADEATGVPYMSIRTYCGSTNNSKSASGIIIALVSCTSATFTPSVSVAPCTATFIGIDFNTTYGIPAITSATESASTINDSGWLNAGTTPGISNFTAFTSEPDKLTVKLIPVGSSPTTGYPSINGFYIKEM